MSHLGTGNESDVAGLLDVPASPADLALLTKISEKQADALRLTLLGESSKEIARKLKVTPRGIDQRLDAARKTLGAASRGEAARKFYQLYCASEGLTSDPFLLGEHAGRQRSEPGGSGGKALRRSNALASVPPYSDSHDGGASAPMRSQIVSVPADPPC